jgi:nucleoside 2-deoxyribosyltransferase
MPFKGEYDDVYWVAMTAAAQAVGAACVRIDREDFEGDIAAKIRDLIEKCDAVIADLSESNPSVLYEVGYAHALSRPCVPVCSTSLDNLPFDVRNLNGVRQKENVDSA